MDIKAAFPSMAKGKLVNLMKVRQMDGDLIRWMESFLSERTADMIIVGNAMERHPVEAGVLQGSPVSPILFAIYTAGLIKWVEEYVSAEGPSFVDDFRGLATRRDAVFRRGQAGPPIAVPVKSAPGRPASLFPPGLQVFSWRPACRLYLPMYKFNRTSINIFC